MVDLSLIPDAEEDAQEPGIDLSGIPDVDLGGIPDATGDTFIQDNPDQVEKMAESYMLAESMGMDPDQAYDMHDELVKQMGERDLSFAKEVKDGIVGGMRVAGATFASLGSGIAGGLTGLVGLPTISTDPDKWIEYKPGLLTGATLEESAELVQEVAAGPPSAFIKTEEEAKVMELMDKIPELAGKGWQLIGEESIDLAISARRAVRGDDVDVSDLEAARQVVVPFLGTVGEVSGEFAEFLPMASSKAKVVVDKIKGTDFYQKLTPKEKIDVADKVVETAEQNPNLTEDQILESVEPLADTGDRIITGIKDIEPTVTETGRVLEEQKIRDLNLAATEVRVQREKAPMGFDTDVRSYEGDGYRTTQISEGDLPIQNKFKIDIEPERKEALKTVIQHVETAEAGGRTFTEAEVGGGTDVTGYGSTYPEFMRNEGWTGKEVVNALNKAMEGKDLGVRQTTIVEGAIGYVNEMAAETPGFEGFQPFEFGAEPKRKIPSKKKLIEMVKKDKLLPEITRLRFTEALRGVKTEQQTRNVVRGIENAWKLAIERKYTSDIQKAKSLQKVDNYRKALRLPTIQNMTMKQMDQWQKAMEPLHKGDVLLTQRQLETIDNTELKGMKTIREVKDEYSKKTGIPLNQIQNITVDSFDRMRYDTSLAKQNPFYEMMVKDYHKDMLSSEERYLEFENTSNELAKVARKSRKKTKILDKLIPTDDMVFDYLSAPDKTVISKKMTPEELQYAEWLDAQFAEALEYLVATDSLKTGRENYITNIRRDFWETLKDEGLKKAGKEIFNQQKLDEQTFNILDQMTGDILPLNKFFKYSMRRTGDITPTKNVAKAASTYFRTLEKKKALDAFMPKMMVFVDALTPPQVTPKGLIKDQTLNTFVKEWINTKKGRPSKLVLTPGSKIDLVTRSLKGFVQMMDLGLNLPVGVAATVGEGVTTYVGLGKKNMATGIKRLNSKQGKAITERYKNFVGKSVWSQLREASGGLSDKMSTAMFGLFQQSATRANKVHLLGSLTDAEFNSGKISPERLAEIKVEMGKYRAIEGMKSIVGATTEGQLFTQYKSWAIPILSTTTRNLGNMAKNVMQKSEQGVLQTQEFNEFKDAIEITTAALIVMAMVPDDESSFVGTMINKAKRESLTILGAIDPTFWTSTPRMMQWAAQVTEVAKELITLEQYSETAPVELRGELKGIEGAKEMTTPRLLQQFGTEPTTGLAN